MTIVTNKILTLACVVGVFPCPTEQASVRERRSREGIGAKKAEEESICILNAHPSLTGERLSKHIKKVWFYQTS